MSNTKWLLSQPFCDKILENPPCRVRVLPAAGAIRRRESQEGSDLAIYF